MASYFIGSNGPSSGFGGGGNFVSQLGQIGPVWRDTMLDGMNTAARMQNFEAFQAVQPDKVQATGSNYALQALNNQYNMQEQALNLNAQRAEMVAADARRARDAALNMGMNTDQLSYGAPTTNIAPPAAQPTVPAYAGAYAQTAPQLYNPYAFAPAPAAGPSGIPYPAWSEYTGG